MSALEVKEVVKDTEAGFVDLLRKRYPSPSFEVIPGVRNKAAFDATNTCDALAMGIWPSRGLHLHGFEIKCSRSDWLNEIKKPWKADAFQPYCDFWWLVAAPGIVQAGELPESWGHLERKARSLVVVKDAPLNEASQPLSRSMLAAIVKRHGAPDIDLKNQVRAELIAEVTKEVESKRAYKVERLEKLAIDVQVFKDATGIDIERNYHGPRLGEAVAALLQGDPTARLQYQRDELKKILSDLDMLLEAKTVVTVPEPPAPVSKEEEK